MANTQAPFGLKPVRYLDGSAWNGKATLYRASTSSAIRLGMYEPVEISDTGGNSDGILVVKKATTLATAQGTASIRGSVVGFSQGTPGHLVAALAPPTTDHTYYLPAGTHGYVWVADDPRIIFHCQGDSALTAARHGLNCAIGNTSCSTTTGLSAAFVDTSTYATATRTLKVLGSAKKQGNVVGSTYETLEVMINLHELAQSSEAKA